MLGIFASGGVPRRGPDETGAVTGDSADVFSGFWLLNSTGPRIRLIQDSVKREALRGRWCPRHTRKDGENGPNLFLASQDQCGGKFTACQEESEDGGRAWCRGGGPDISRRLAMRVAATV